MPSLWTHPPASLYTQRPSRLEQLQQFLTPEWAKPFAGMSAEQANKEAQILNGPQAPGKIGPGYLSDTQRLGQAVGDIASWGLPEMKAGATALKAATPAAMAIAKKAVPWRPIEKAAVEQAALHPDAQRDLIRILYGDAAADRDASQKAASAAWTHRMEQENGFYLVNDPVAREQEGLPPIPENAPRLPSGGRAIPGGPLAPQIAATQTVPSPFAAAVQTQPAPARGWLSSLIERGNETTPAAAAERGTVGAPGGKPGLVQAARKAMPTASRGEAGAAQVWPSDPENASLVRNLLFGLTGEKTSPAYKESQDWIKATRAEREGHEKTRSRVLSMTPEELRKTPEWLDYLARRGGQK